MTCRKALPSAPPWVEPPAILPIDCGAERLSISSQSADARHSIWPMWQSWRASVFWYGRLLKLSLCHFDSAGVLVDKWLSGVMLNLSF